jgi:hypothetical protein
LHCIKTARVPRFVLSLRETDHGPTRQPSCDRAATPRREAPRNADPSAKLRSTVWTADREVMGHRSQGRARVARLACPDLDTASWAPRPQSHCPRRGKPGRHYSLERPMALHAADNARPILRPATVKSQDRKRAGACLSSLSVAQARTGTIRWWPSPGTGGQIVGRGKAKCWMTISTRCGPVWPKRPGRKVDASMTFSGRRKPHAIRAPVCRTAVMMHAVTMHVAKSSARTGGSAHEEKI